MLEYILQYSNYSNIGCVSEYEAHKILCARYGCMKCEDFFVEQKYNLSNVSLCQLVWIILRALRYVLKYEDIKKKLSSEALTLL